jgi:hypothetical protein
MKDTDAVTVRRRTWERYAKGIKQPAMSDIDRKQTFELRSAMSAFDTRDRPGLVIENLVSNMRRHI